MEWEVGMDRWRTANRGAEIIRHALLVKPFLAEILIFPPCV